MPKKTLSQILQELRSGASDLGGRTSKTVAQVSDSLGRVLDEAGSEGAKLRKSLVRNWTSRKSARRGRSAPVLLGLLALGAAMAYLLGRTSPPESGG